MSAPPMFRRLLPSRRSMSGDGHSAHCPSSTAGLVSSLDVAQASRDELKAEVMELRSLLISAKIDLAVQAGEIDQLRHALAKYQRGPATSAVYSLFSTISAFLALSLWRQPTTSANAVPVAAITSVQLRAPQDRSDAVRAIRSHKTFRDFSDEQVSAITEALVEVYCSPGQVIIQEGSVEDARCYVVASGEYSVLVHSKGSEPVHAYRNSGELFGELALRYGSPRKATVRCDHAGVLWALDRDTFQRIRESAPRRP